MRERAKEKLEVEAVNYLLDGGPEVWEGYKQGSAPVLKMIRELKAYYG